MVVISYIFLLKTIIPCHNVAIHSEMAFDLSSKVKCQFSIFSSPVSFIATLLFAMCFVDDHNMIYFFMSLFPSWLDTVLIGDRIFSFSSDIDGDIVRHAGSDGVAWTRGDTR